MSDEFNATNGASNIIETKDLGNGTKQVTFSVDNSSLNKYVEMFEANGVKFDVEGDNPKIAKGSVMNRYTPWTQDYSMFYTSNQLPYTQAMQIPLDQHQKIAFAMELYFKDPYVGTVVDLMVDFSASGFTNECEDDEIKQLYDAWAKEIKLNNLIEGIFLEFYRSGNVTILRSDKYAKVTKSTKGKRTKKQLKSDTYKFPAGYTILNPMNVYVMGSLMFDQEVVYLSLNDELLGLVRPDGFGMGGGEFIQNLMENLPNDIINNMKNGNPKYLPLDPKRTSRITRKKQQYERYAIPFMERIFESVLYKQKLRMMDMSTIEGLVNQLVTVTIGDKDYPASDDDLKAIASLFSTPHKAYTIFWNHTLQVKFHKPEGIETLNADKYKQVNEDILAGLGVPRVLMDGEGDNFSAAWVSILSLIERLENARQKVSSWIEDEYKQIAEENGFNVYPTVRFNKMNLREDTYIRDVLLAMYDRGLIDEEDILTETGRDFKSVIEMKQRNEQYKDLFLPPEQPFQGGQTAPNDGRPPAPNKNGYKSRETSPEQNSGKPPKPKKRTASYQKLEEDYEKELTEIYHSIQSDVQSTIEKHKDKDRDYLESLIMATIVASFKQISLIGSRFIDDAFDQEIDTYGGDINSSALAKMKKDLVDWNNGYVSKLANDIKDKIFTGLTKGLDVEDSISHAFNTNLYRVQLMSQAGIVESVRKAKLEVNKAMGNTRATWIAHVDDEKTCGTCRGLHGQTFDIGSVPPRPHSGCRCDLHFE